MDNVKCRHSHEWVLLQHILWVTVIPVTIEGYDVALVQDMFWVCFSSVCYVCAERQESWCEREEVLIGCGKWRSSQGKKTVRLGIGVGNRVFLLFLSCSTRQLELVCLLVISLVSFLLWNVPCFMTFLLSLWLQLIILMTAMCSVVVCFMKGLREAICWCCYIHHIDVLGP